MCCQQLHKEAVHQPGVAFDNFSGEVVLKEAGNCDFGSDKVLKPSQRETRLPTLPLMVFRFFLPRKSPIFYYSGRFKWCTMELNWHSRFSQMLKMYLMYPFGKEPKGNACIGGAWWLGKSHSHGPIRLVLVCFATGASVLCQWTWQLVLRANRKQREAKLEREFDKSIKSMETNQIITSSSPLDETSLPPHEGTLCTRNTQ